MIQVNLLPDVKLEFIKAERTKHAVISAAVIATGVSFLIFLLLFIAVHVVQKKLISDHNADIKTYTKELKDTPDLDKILTIQNQLGALPSLHTGKPAASRTFDLIRQMTPPAVSLTDVTVDFVANTISISGSAPQLSDMNTMVDTVKYTDYLKSGSQGSKAFSNVVVSDFSRNPKASTFTISATYNREIFDNAIDTTFKVPNGVSTPSVVDQPTFTKPINGTTGQ